MSTKIYDGFFLPNITTIPALQTWLMEMREKCSDVHAKIMAKHMAEKSTQILDAYFMHQFDLPKFNETVEQILEINRNEDDNRRMTRRTKNGYLVDDNVWSMVFWFIDDEVKKAKGSMLWHEGINIGFDITVIPVGDKVLGLPFTECREYLDVLTADTEYQFYGYWNNVDPDEKCTEAEWKQREDDWEIALPGIGIPARTGMTAQIIPQETHMDFTWERAKYFPMVLELMNATPTADRIATYAKRIIRGEAIRDAWNAHEAKLKQEAADAGEEYKPQHSEFFRIEREVSDGIKANWDTIHKAEYDKLVADFTAKIPETYDESHLITKWNAPEPDDEE